MKHIYTNYTVSEYYCQNIKQILLSRLITTNERKNEYCTRLNTWKSASEHGNNDP